MKRQQGDNIIILTMALIHLALANGAEKIYIDNFMLMVTQPTNRMSVSANVVWAFLNQVILFHANGAFR
jgi:hypothetical protein